MFMFFTRYGVLGESAGTTGRGQYQTSPFDSAQGAVREFSKYFKLKTANEWRSVAKFVNFVL